MKDYWQISHCWNLSEQNCLLNNKKSEAYFREKGQFVKFPSPNVGSFIVMLIYWNKLLTITPTDWILKWANLTLPTKHLLPTLWQELFACCFPKQRLNVTPILHVILAVSFSNTLIGCIWNITMEIIGRKNLHCDTCVQKKTPKTTNPKNPNPQTKRNPNQIPKQTAKQWMLIL